MKTIVETERLVLREAVEEDAEAFHAFNSDPRVMGPTGEPPWGSVTEARQRLREYPDYRKHGYGRWAVVYKPHRCVVGFCGLKYLDELDEVDLGYRLAFGYWGRGIATESSLAVLKHGFEVLGLQRIVGLVLPVNTASINVLRKVGMSRESTVTYCGDEAQLWSVDFDAWNQGQVRRVHPAKLSLKTNEQRND